MSEKKPPTKTNKRELIMQLTELGYSDEQLSDSEGKKLKRPELLELLKSHMAGDKAVDELSKIIDSDDNEDDLGIAVMPDVKSDTKERESDGHENEEIISPQPHDPGWTQYVLGKFLPDEVDGKNPRVEGLRRVANELIGTLLEEGCDLVSSPSENNRFRASVKAWAVFQKEDGTLRRYEALADAHADNCFEDYATYLVAMADTRAKGRVFRNALCLRRVVSAEEVNKTAATTEDTQKGSQVHTGQISLIRLMSERNGFSISEVLGKLGIDCDVNESTGDENLQSLSYENALAVVIEMRKMKEQKEVQ
jgi:hypothetical protein